MGFKQLQQTSTPLTLTSLILRFGNGIRRAIDMALNGVFSLTHSASRVRSSALSVGFLVAWMVAIVIVVPADDTRQILQKALVSFINLAADPRAFTEAILALTFRVLFHPVVIRHLLALYAPYWLMHQITAIYLADIFEKDEEVSRRFIMQAALGQAYNTIHVGQGKVAEADQGSSIIQIGGPGYVIVELDSAVLFERPDGSPHVVGPTSKVVIDDFERIRRVIDLRDSIEQVDLSAARSKDGIIIGAKDVQFSYSIYRGENPNRDLQTPYPFSAKAVESLVYKDTRTVKPGVAPTRAPEWQSGPFKMGGPIMAEMGGFIGKRGLSEFLASIGDPEETSFIDREKQIDLKTRQLSGRNGNMVGEQPLKPGPFASRSFLTDTFYSDFQKRMADKGFQLNWIGVGTWNTPDIILANHREAWKTSRENLTRGSAQNLKTLRSDARLQELLRLIRTVPIRRFAYYDGRKTSDDELAEQLLGDYEETLQQALELYTKGGDPIDRRYDSLVGAAGDLILHFDYSGHQDFEAFLQDFVLRYNQPARMFEPDLAAVYEEFLRRATDLYETYSSTLSPADIDFLQSVIKLYNDVKTCNQIQRAIDAVRDNRVRHHRVGS